MAIPMTHMLTHPATTHMIGPGCFHLAIKHLSRMWKWAIRKISYFREVSSTILVPLLILHYPWPETRVLPELTEPSPEFCDIDAKSKSLVQLEGLGLVVPAQNTEVNILGHPKTIDLAWNQLPRALGISLIPALEGATFGSPYQFIPRRWERHQSLRNYPVLESNHRGTPFIKFSTPFTSQEACSGTNLV
jgi:hypothetical protein